MKVCNVCGYVAEGDDFSEKCVVCKKCDWSSSWEERDLKQISQDKAFIDAMMKLKAEDPIEYQIKLRQLGVLSKEDKDNNIAVTNQVTCPYCHSTNVKKISGTSKAASVALWGIFSQKVRKNFHCNNCNSDF